MSNQRFPTLTPEQMTPDQKRMADAIAAGPRGSLRGPFNVLLRSPDLGDRVQRVGEYVRFKSSLPQRLNELGILLVARKWTAQYEWYAHRTLALKAGLSAVICDAIAEGKRPANMAADEAVVYNFAHELLETTQVSDANFNAMTAMFGEQGAVDLIGALGYYTVVSMVLNVGQVALPPDAVPLKPLR